MGVCICKSNSRSPVLQKKTTLDQTISPEPVTGALSTRVRNLITPLASHLPIRTEECLDSHPLPLDLQPSDWSTLLSTFSSHSLFTVLPVDIHKALIQEMKVVWLPSGGIVCKQDQHGTNFYVIKQGIASVQVSGQEVKELSTGCAFGELALLQNTRRTATVVAKTEMELWTLEQSAFAVAVRAVNAMRYRETKDFINKVTLLDGLSFKQKDALLDVVVALQFGAGESVTYEGQPAHMMFIVTTGSVTLYTNSTPVRTVTSGEIFGEKAIYHANYKHEFTAVADTVVSVLALDRTNALYALGPQMETILMRRVIELSFASNRTLKKLPSEVRERLLNCITVQRHSPPSIVFTRGQHLGSSVYIVLEGSLKNASSTIFAQAGDCIGEEEVGMTNPTTRIIEDVLAAEDVFIGEISKERWLSCLSTEPLDTSDSESMISLRKVTVFQSVKRAKLSAMARVSDYTGVKNLGSASRDGYSQAG